MGAIAERRPRTQATTETLRTRQPIRPVPDERPALQDQFSRIRHIVAGAYGLGSLALLTKPADPRGQLARSVAIALARDMLSADLDELAAHFGCAGAEEAAAHCNLVAARCERECRLRITVQFLRGACVTALGLDKAPTSPIEESPL